MVTRTACTYVGEMIELSLRSGVATVAHAADTRRAQLAHVRIIAMSECIRREG